MAVLEEKTDDTNVDDQLQMLLQEAGLDSVPIDPTSLEALKSFVASDARSVPSSVRTPEEYSTVKVTMDENRPPRRPHNPPMSEVEPHPELKRFTSELTSPSADSLASAMEESSVAVAGPFVNVEGASPVENQILEQLHRQTRLLLEMQRRIDDLTATVEHLTRGGGVPTGIPPRKMQEDPPPDSGWEVATPRIITRTPPVTSATTRTQPPPPVAVRPPARAAVVPHRNNAGLLMAIRNSRLLKVVYLFWTLRRRHVQELDGGLIFKILFMMAILTARMSSSGKSKHGDPDWHTKFAGLTLLVLIGFFMQTGYLQYCYTFFVKENYPERIFNGEEVNDIIRNPNNNNNNPQQNNNDPAARAVGAPPVPRGPLPPNHPPRPAGAAGGWRNTFLGGMIPQADQGGVAGALQDVALLFGSFLMSIFPMWQPEGPPPPRPLPQGQEPPPPPGGVAAGPGAVAPPRNAMQPADDSDDEGGN